MQGLNLAFQLDDKSLSQNISLEMIELVGRYDMNLCSQLIAFYQVNISSSFEHKLYLLIIAQWKYSNT